ncbi:MULTISPECIES: hypothetical protein [Marinimicrobium]|jgi:hypothetical protein|uniref:Uncharacterized protein n=1 Tax=Marinimicrobium koreense TaxID=306545 RepID=A0A3N1NXS9_9GAMM|nr:MULTISPECIES: hypothetical protein [Marinimicrobium]ROQ20639.1 hypothetical protein EDC38_1252 [Marinimicrobium koreense]UZJ45907.1 hypothetical protein OOT55_07630 [Marinimicrobium sp. C6131]
MKTSQSRHNTENVVDLFTGKSLSELHDQRFVRLAPELDGLEMLYSNDTSDDRLFSLKILCWGLRANGEVVGLVPWLNDIVACPDICDPLNGQWEGYYDPGIDDVFFDAPIHKVVELETAAEYYELQCENDDDVVQELPDTIGTHAVLATEETNKLNLVEVISWRLQHDGSIYGMLTDMNKIVSTPVLPGDACLYPAQQSDQFRYFFQHQIANKIKAEDPEALAAISLLVDGY